MLAGLLLALAVAPAGAEKITLENGDAIDVTIVSETEDSLVVQHPQLGEFTVPRSALKPPDPPNPGLFGTAFMRGWNRSFGFGFGGSSGNSQGASVDSRLSITRNADTYRGDFEVTYFYSSQNSVRNTNAFTAGYQHDFLLGKSRFYLFGNTMYQYDEFQEWLHRISANAGVGYDILKREKVDLRFEVGAGFARTEGIQNMWTPQGVAGLVFAWRLLEGHTFTADLTYYPDLSQWSQYRLVGNAAYQIAITQIDGLSLKFGVNDEYNTTINTTLLVPGVVPPRFQTRNNLKYFGNLVYEF
jgi:putative salt-induced outer membrane protein YdiY